MVSQNSTTRTDTFDLDTCIDRFEEAWNDGGEVPPDLVRFLPAEECSEFCQAAVELIRVDMERRFSRGHAKPLRAYLEAFPWVREQPQWLGELAYEDYRLHLSEGHPVDSSGYSRDYKIDTSAWPSPTQSAARTDAIREWNESTLNVLKQDSERLVQSVANFPNLGEQFGDFRVIEELGEGKFAKVYLAQQGELADRRVALKISAELWSESDKLARLQHTNIVPIYSIHRINGLQALCMPYLGRKTLESELTCGQHEAAPNSDKQIVELRFARFGARLADALAHAHARQIIHRDLKPANILLSDEATNDELEPLILDFNLSENLVVGGRTSLLVGGTLPYMAPEHLHAVVSRARLTPACDIYSLGVILYQLATDELPFPHREGNFVESVLQMVHDRKTDGQWKARLAETVSPDFASIISKCMQPSLEHRYGSASQLRDDLLRHANDQPLKTASNRSPRQTVAKWCRRNRHRLSFGTLAAAAGLLLMIALGFASWQARKTSRLEAARLADTFEREFDGLQLGLLAATAPDLRQQATLDAMAWVDKYGVLARDGWQNRTQYRYLETEQQGSLQAKLGELLFLMSGSVDGNRVEDASMRQMYAAAGACLFSAFELPAPAQSASWDIADLPNESTVGARIAIIDLINAGSFGQAEQRCDEALKNNPADESLWLCKGICELAAGEASMAELSFTHCIALSSEDPEGYFYRGASRLDARRFEAAIKDFDRVLRLEPGLPSAMFNRALALLGVGRPQDALQQLDSTPETQQLSYRIAMLKAAIAKEVEDHQSLERLNQLLLEATPTDPVGWVHRGRLLVSSDTEAAIHAFETALSLLPNYRPALQNLAAMYAEVLDQSDRAHELLQEWTIAYPQDPVPHASRAVLYARDTRIDDALEEIEKSKSRGATAESLYYLASAFAQASKQRAELADDGVEAMRRCLRTDAEGKWFDQAIRDPDLVPLRSDPRFGKVFGAAKLLNEG